MRRRRLGEDSFAPRTARAAVIHGAGDVRVEHVPAPRPGPREVVVQVEWAGICGSDVAYWRTGGSGSARLRRPMVLGHEIAGVVAELGREVESVRIGDRVAVHPARATAESRLPARLAGRANLHSHVRHLGSAAHDPHTDGGFVERIAVDVAQVRAVPRGVDTRSAALAEPLGVALHALNRLESVCGSIVGRQVLVNGAGPIGCLVAAAARHRGARSVVAADLSPDALSAAAAMGATSTIDRRSAELPGDCELVVEASGAARALGDVLRCTARGGTVVQVGNLSGEPAPSVLADLVTRELTWIGSYRFVDEIDEALELMEAGLDVTPLVTATFPLAQVDAALAQAADPRQYAGRVLLEIAPLRALAGQRGGVDPDAGLSRGSVVPRAWRVRTR